MQDLMSFLMGNENSQQEDEFKAIKTTLLENIKLITYFKPLKKIIENGDYFVAKITRNSKGYEDIDEIDFNFETVKERRKKGLNVIIKKFDFSSPKSFLRYIAYSPDIIKKAHLLNQFVDKVPPKTFYCLAEKIIPRGKYFIKNLNPKKKEVDNEYTQLVMEYFKINEKRARGYIELIQLENKDDEFFALLDPGGEVKKKKNENNEEWKEE